MLRVVLFLISAALIAFGIAWFADRPGEVTVTWLGYRIDTSLMVAAFAVALLALFIIIVWSIYRAILSSPDQVSLFFRHRRAVRGYLAITRGLLAIGAGDAQSARSSAADAARLAPDDALTLLLGAQAAQLSGDRVAAERTFRAMAGRADTRQLGLRGLYIEAQRRNDPAAALTFAEEAAKSSPSSWASQAVLEHRSATADWSGALDVLDGMRSSLDKAVYRRQRAVLLTARALALEQTDRDAARSLALEAVKLAPDLVPAAALASRLLAEQNSLRKAARILEAAWRAGPHPDIAATYGNLRFGDSARERRVRVKRLVDKGPEHIEGALALAQASLEAGDATAARSTLTPYVQLPTRRVATLMSEIEEVQGDVGRAREWLSRAMRAAPDPVWTADGVVSERWLPVSPVSGRLDAFQWKLPVAEIGVERAPIELEPAAAAAPKEKEKEEIPPVQSSPAPAVEPPRRVRAKAAPAPEPVIPLVHAPDDPGPDHASESDPVPEPASPPKPWEKLMQLFR
jgi:HemY protein